MKKQSLVIVGLLIVLMLCGCVVQEAGEVLTPEAQPTVAATKVMTPVVTATPVASVVVVATASPKPFERPDIQLSDSDMMDDLTLMPVGHDLDYYKSLSPAVYLPFTLSDWTFNGLPYGTASASVVGAVGSPLSTETVEWDATGDVFIEYTYDFGVISFQDNQMQLVSVTSAGYPGPRGIEVGDTLEEVIMTFCSTYEKADNNSIIFYRENTGRNNFEALPPSGGLYEYGDRTLYYAWTDISEYEGQDIDSLESFIMYDAHYNFSIQFDSNDVITSYHLSYGASAE